MQDALLIYLMITNTRHAGGFRFAAHLVHDAGVQCMAVWFAITRNWNTAVAAIGRKVLTRIMLTRIMLTRIMLTRIMGNGGRTRRRASALARFCPGAATRLGAQSDWLQALTRLENYVVSIR